jgi:arylsulfatase A-like enzyme
MRVPCLVRWPGRVPGGAVCGSLATAMDLYPTLAALGGATLPADRTIDGRDIGGMLFGSDERSPHDVFLYYRGNDLEAVRSGRWKLHLAKRGASREHLYDLEVDVQESVDVLAGNAEVVARLRTLAERARTDLGDARLGVIGADVRPAGEVDAATTLTSFDASHPYAVAEYDLPDRG